MAAILLLLGFQRSATIFKSRLIMNQLSSQATDHAEGLVRSSQQTIISLKNTLTVTKHTVVLDDV